MSNQTFSYLLFYNWYAQNTTGYSHVFRIVRLDRLYDSTPNQPKLIAAGYVHAGMPNWKLSSLINYERHQWNSNACTFVLGLTTPMEQISWYNANLLSTRNTRRWLLHLLILHGFCCQTTSFGVNVVIQSKEVDDPQNIYMTTVTLCLPIKEHEIWYLPVWQPPRSFLMSVDVTPNSFIAMIYGGWQLTYVPTLW